MRTLVRAAVVGAVILMVGAGGVASAQPPAPDPPTPPAPPSAPSPSPADQAARYACLQENLDFAELPQQSLQDPVAFSALVADAAQKCEDVTAEPAG